jgi:hypothetical protein
VTTVAVVATLSKGYDLDYAWRQVVSPGAAADREGAGYYLRTAEAGGEPPGRWWGTGATALGLAPGSVVEREPYLRLFGQRQAPDGAQLTRPPSGGRQAADIYAGLLAAEPHATSERKRELAAEAAAQARRSPLYFDLTVSLSKSISVFHASLGENARLACQAGDAQGEAYWSSLVGEVDAIIWDAVRAGLGYFQREAGFTRTGSHASRVDGRETGQWREADLAAALWLQHVSRDGDMQLHVHCQIAHVARTQADGKWRAPDSYGYNEHVAAAGSIVSQHLEEALTGRFGLEWTARDDGHGFEISGISGEAMRLFSSRRESITADVRERARAFQAQHGRAPDQRELARIAQASNFATRAPKEHAALDFDALHAGWSARLDRALGAKLASVAPSVWHQRGAGHAGARPLGDAALTQLAQERAARKALALAQAGRATWTRADLVKHLGRVLPRTGLDPGAAARLLEELADRAVGGEFEPVVCLEAPEAVQVPRDLIRVDGRSVYQRHGCVRYATRVQLSVEEQMTAHAQARGAPSITREQAARALGASITQLDAALTQPARGGHEAPGTPAPGFALTQSGLRLDQAAAAFSVLTDNRTVSVIDAPAGSGKTRVLAAAARAWTRSGAGRVVGIAPSQSARNTLAAAGIPSAYNTAAFLGHIPGERGARGPVDLRPGDLVVGDEASMWSTADLADVIACAAASGAKVILAGDTAQLQAVESGGGMTLLAQALGHVRLAEPVRFDQEWERAASLRLRDGDLAALAALAEYDDHGRIYGGEPEEMMDAAARAYVAWTLLGKDVLLMAADHARRRELCRRIRDDLIHLGHVTNGPAVPIAGGQRASAGDLIVCTRNDYQTEAGEPGRALSNGDLLLVREVTPHGLLVRRALDADPVTGARRWAERAFLYQNYAESELGYAVTDHVAQSRTVHAGLALITGYNAAFVSTVTPKAADPQPGTRPAPELARHDRQAAQRHGHPMPQHQADPETREQALSVLAQVIGRDGQERSATATRLGNLANADHLAILHAIWQDQVTPHREQHYRQLLDAALPAQHRGEASHKAKWLWRTLRAAELAGHDPAQALQDAVNQASLAGARDVAAVVDARIRRRIPSPVPQGPRPWAEQVPETADPERHRFLAELAQAMDDRARRIGEHAACHALPWAVNALGPVPADLLDRLDWQRNAAVIGAYRELSGWDHPGEPVGPEPAGDTPDKRAAWPRSPPTRPATAPTCAPFQTGCCGTCATPTRPTPPGRPAGQATSSGKPAAALMTPGSRPSVPAPKQRFILSGAVRAWPSGTRNSPPAARPSKPPTNSGSTSSPPSWTIARPGSRRRPGEGSWPSPRMPNCAAATPPSGSNPSAPRNPSRSQMPRSRTSTWRQDSQFPKWASGSKTSSSNARPSLANSPAGRPSPCRTATQA